MSGTAIAAHTVNFDSTSSIQRSLRSGGSKAKLTRIPFAFLVLTELPFTSTMLDTASAAQGSSIRDTEYHAWVAVRRTLEAHRCGYFTICPWESEDS